MKMSLVLLLSSGVTFCHLVLPLVIWCYLLSSGVTSCQLVLPLVNDVTPCILFHKKDKWHNWSKLYYSWIKLTLITMYKSSFLYIKWNKIQLWKLVMQLKWNSTTTYPNIVKKTSAPKKISYIMHNFPVYYVCNHFYIKIIFHFPKKNNFMLATPQTERY